MITTLNTDDFSDRYRLVPGYCPNRVCNCIGLCLPIRVMKDDTRTDDEIRADNRRSRGWS